MSTSLHVHVFKRGTKVLMRNSQRDSKKGDKMKRCWLGPYIIHKHLKKGVYQVANDKGNVLKAAVNQCRLKVHHTSDEMPVPSSDFHT